MAAGRPRPRPGIPERPKPNRLLPLALLRDASPGLTVWDHDEERDLSRSRRVGARGRGASQSIAVGIVFALVGAPPREDGGRPDRHDGHVPARLLAHGG